MLHIIQGRALSGKTTEVIKRIGQGLNIGKKAILIVPDQATFSAEMLLCRQLNLPGFIDIEVLSWNRLCDKLLKEAGTRSVARLDDRGRCMLLESALLSCKEQLAVFGAVSKRKGFVQKLSRMIALLKSCNITPEQLLKFANSQNEGFLKQKLLDTRLLYSQYEQLLAQGYQDNYDCFVKAAQAVMQSRMIRGTDLYIDGFEVLTTQMLSMIAAFLDSAGEVTLALATERDAPDKALYGLQERTLDAVLKLAQQQHIPVQSITVAWNGMLFSPEIQHLRNNLYAYPSVVYKQKCENIQIYNAKNYESEVIHCAAVIYKKVREEGYRYREFCVCSNNFSAYSPLIRRIFADYNIPVFADNKRPLLTHPMVSLLLCALKCASQGFTTENVLHYVNSPFIHADRKDTDALQTYCVLLGIRSWEIDQGQIYRGTKEQQEELLTLRERVLGPVIELKEQLQKVQQDDKTAKGYTLALYSFIERMELEQRLNEHLAHLEAEGLQAVADEHRQTWNLTLELLEQLRQLLQNTAMTLEEYVHILEEGFAASEVGVLPTSVDCVFLGDLTRSKYSDVKITMVLGMNYGVVPSADGSEGILSDRETALLNSDGMGLSPDSQSLQLQQNYDIYSALIRPYEQLYLSYSVMGDEGEGLAPSVLIHKIKSMFPELKTLGSITNEQETLKELLLTPKAALLPLAKALGVCQTGEQPDPAFLDFYAYLCTQSDSQTVLKQLKAALLLQSERSLPVELAKTLYFSRASVSISRLEQFASCPFAHFITYGLRPDIREEFEASSMDLGSLFHEILEKFLITIQSGADVASLSKEAVFELADKLFYESVPKYHFGVLNATARSQSFNRQLRIIARTASWEAARQLASGRFIPVGAEIEFGEGKTLPPIQITTPEGVLQLKGIIDRCDLYEKDGKCYLRVIDYKSGNKNFSADKLMDGTQIQLPLYMKTLCEAYSGAVPSGAFYFHIAELEGENRIVLDGPVLKDKEILTAMDTSLMDKGKSDIIKVKYNAKNNEFVQNGNLYTPKGFQAILNLAQNKAQQLAEQMLKGEIEALPVHYKKQEHPCSWCDYKNLCMRGIRACKERKASQGGVEFLMKEGEDHAGMDA